MSSFGAASAASAYVPVPVIARETLHAGSIVKMKVPIGASDGTYPNGDEEIPFLQFCHTIRGGRVNFFVHTNDSAVRGKTITASASVLKKTLEDGREYLYVDLAPVSDETPITHRLAVMNNIDGSWDSDDHLIFETPEPLDGLIIFAPPGAKVVPGNNIQHDRFADEAVHELFVIGDPEDPEKPSTGDSQLDRLLAAGWEIDSQDSVKVDLFKMKGDQRKTMVHHRPKSRRK